MAAKKPLILGAAVMCSVVVAGFAYFVAQPVLSPFARTEVPAACNLTASHLPESRGFTIPGYGAGTLVAEGAGVAVVVKANPGDVPFVVSVFVIRTATQEVMRTLTFPTDIVDAGFDGDRLYLFNDKLGFFIDGSSGATLSNIVESDNYRGLFTEGGRRFVQSDITVSAVTGSWQLILRHHFHMASIAYGCFMP
jgi:hypothetical protein